MKAIPLFASLLLIGCLNDPPKDTGDTEDTDTADTDTDTDTEDTDTDTDTEVPCTATFTGVTPIDNAMNVSVGATVVATFSEAVTAGQWDLEVVGRAGSATLADDGLSATFTPLVSLDYDGNFTVEATVCDTTSTSSFYTTSAPLETSDIEGKTYVFDFATVTWVAPSLMSTFSGLIDLDLLLIHVIAVDETADTIDMAAAPGEVTSTGTIHQIPCQPVIGFDAVDFSSNPAIELGPVDMEFPTPTGAWPLHQVHLTGVFSDDGDSLDDIDMQGTLDTRYLDGLLDIGAGPMSWQDICDTSVIFGDSCKACDDSVEACLDIHIMVDEAPAGEDVSFNPNYDPSLDAACD